jgi:centriolar protein POC1
LILIHDTRSPVRAPAINSISGAKGKQHAYSHFTSLDWFPLSDFLIAVGTSDASVRIYDLRQSRIIQYYEAHNGPISSVGFHQNGKYLISGGSDGIIKIYDLLDGRVLFTIRAHTGAVRSVKFTQNCEQFATAGNDKTIYLWKSNLSDSEGNFGIGAGDVSRSQLDISLSPLRVHSRSTMPKSVISERGSHSDGFDSNSTESVRLDKDCHSTTTFSRKASFPRRRESTQLGRESSSSEHNLLQGIVSQIGNLADAITLLEKRLSIVESMVDQIAKK